MSESDVNDEREAIRERKRERLRRELSEGDDGPGDDGGTGAGAGGSPDPVHVEDVEEFDRRTAEGVVLVDYYADWCGPCKMLEPVVESVAADTPATVLKVDIDRHRDLATRANVRGVPTLVLYAGGDPVERLVGMQREDRLRSLIEEHA